MARRISDSIWGMQCYRARSSKQQKKANHRSLSEEVSLNGAGDGRGSVRDAYHGSNLSAEVFAQRRTLDMAF